MNHDLTKAQFLTALDRNGLELVGLWGYVQRKGDKSLIVSWHNGGGTHRAGLAWVLNEFAKHDEKQEQEK